MALVVCPFKILNNIQGVRVHVQMHSHTFDKLVV